MGVASEGIWTWDAVDSSYFVLRAYLCGVKGDVLGSAMLNGMAEHAAPHGDCFNMMEGAHMGKEKVQCNNIILFLHPKKRLLIKTALTLTLIIYQCKNRGIIGWQLINCYLQKLKRSTNQLCVRQVYHTLHYALPVPHFLIYHAPH